MYLTHVWILGVKVQRPVKCTNHICDTHVASCLSVSPGELSAPVAGRSLAHRCCSDTGAGSGESADGVVGWPSG